MICVDVVMAGKDIDLAARNLNTVMQITDAKRRQMGTYPHARASTSQDG